jgi:hypothetical protein
MLNQKLENEGSKTSPCLNTNFLLPGRQTDNLSTTNRKFLGREFLNTSLMVVLNTMPFFGLKEEDVVIENNSAHKGWCLEEMRLRIVQILKEFTG